MINSELAVSNSALIDPSVSLDDAHQMPCVEDRLLQDQVARILRSEEMRGSEVLRRLLKFLADKSVSGEADELKEYVLATDGLGKPSSYDPRHNSSVRIQVGRLRQKLMDYYRTEGLEDPLIIDLPKGRFKLKYEYRSGKMLAADRIASPSPIQVPEESESKKSLSEGMRGSRVGTFVLVALAIVIASAFGFRWLEVAKANAASATYPPGWSADMEDLWRPFIASNRPLLVAIEDPLFVELNANTGIYYRDKSLNDWNDVKSSATVAAIRHSVKDSGMQPSRYYTAFGEVDASFMLAKLLGQRAQNLTVIKTSDLSFQQLADNNVLFVGVQNIFFDHQVQAMPIQAPLQPSTEGIRNLHPGPGEPSMFLDQYSRAPTEEGIAYALITHLPGPLGTNDIESFTSTTSAGYVAAVKACTDPAFVRILVAELKQSSAGRMPRYYQAVLKVKFADQVPTKVSFVLARELH